MDNSQKYLSIGFAVALVIALAVKGVTMYGVDANFWMMVLGSIGAGMIYLVFSIFMSTKKLVPAKMNTQQDKNNKQ